MPDIILNQYPLLKALHLVAMVAWFGGLFYLVRIFVYHAEAFDRPDAERAILVPQYEIMEERVMRIICRPAMLLTWTFGMLLLFCQGWDWFKVQYWMHLKLFLLILLSGYTDYNSLIRKRLKGGKMVMSSFRFRLWNEVPTLLLLAIILLAVYRNSLAFGQAFLGILIFGMTLFFFAKRYKAIRRKSNT
ncbi:MAG: CopD family protein [Bacteroidota bacterium]